MLSAAVLSPLGRVRPEYLEHLQRPLHIKLMPFFSNSPPQSQTFSYTRFASLHHCNVIAASFRKKVGVPLTAAAMDVSENQMCGSLVYVIPLRFQAYLCVQTRCVNTRDINQFTQPILVPPVKKESSERQLYKRSLAPGPPLPVN